MFALAADEINFPSAVMIINTLIASNFLEKFFSLAFSKITHIHPILDDYMMNKFMNGIF